METVINFAEDPFNQSNTTPAVQRLMNLTRVLLSVEHQLHAQILKSMLLSSDDVEVIGETQSMVDSLRFIATHKPDLWIHSWDDVTDRSAVMSHAYSIHPNLAVVRVHPDEPIGLMQLQVNSLSQLIDVASRNRRPHVPFPLEAVGSVT